jgi:hypothetical protein
MSYNVTVIPSESELNSYRLIAKVAASNPHWKKLGGNGDEETVIATILSVMLLARELGFSPMQSVSGGINNIQGKFEISARLMNQAIRARGHKLTVKILTDEVCKIWGKRKDTGEEMEVSYHIEEARRSGLVREGGPWKKTPQDMLFARAISRMARRLYPDCIGSCYVEGEIQEQAQGKILEAAVEVPDKGEIEFMIEHTTSLDLPTEIDKERVDTFIEETAAQTKWSLEDLRKRASENMEGFLSKFKKWEEKRYAGEVFELYENVG